MTMVGPQGRCDGLLPVNCWCERLTRPMSEQDVWDGVGWCCQHRDCASHAPAHLYMRLRRGQAHATSINLRARATAARQREAS